MMKSKLIGWTNSVFCSSIFFNLLFTIIWDVDSVDWKEQGEEVEYNKVMKKVKAGSILLYHNNAKYTPSNLNRIIPELQKQWYKFVTVGELIYTEDAYVDKDGVQHRK